MNHAVNGHDCDTITILYTSFALLLTIQLQVKTTQKAAASFLYSTSHFSLPGYPSGSATSL